MKRVLVFSAIFVCGFFLPQVGLHAVNCTNSLSGCFTWTNNGNNPYPGYCCTSGAFADHSGGPAYPGYPRKAIPSTGQCSDLWQVAFGQCDNIMCFACCGGQKYSKNCSDVPAHGP